MSGKLGVSLTRHKFSSPCGPAIQFWRRGRVSGAPGSLCSLSPPVWFVRGSTEKVSEPSSNSSPCPTRDTQSQGTPAARPVVAASSGSSLSWTLPSAKKGVTSDSQVCILRCPSSLTALKLPSFHLAKENEEYAFTWGRTMFDAHSCQTAQEKLV